MATRKVRYKKLNIKTPLPVLREDQVDPSEYESLTNENQIATGVEQGEENEIHLQAVLKGAGVAADKEIPVPPPEESTLNYDELYPQTFSKTATYIRFSQTVEECVGCLYDMTDEDVAFLKSYNQKAGSSSRLSDDDFERIMEVFEDTAHHKTPFASVDQTIAPYEDMVPGLQELEMPKFSPMSHAKEIYEYWKSRRQASSNKSLHPTLKFETHQENDDMDPYVCFRRREVRQTRKTRARDVQSADKLKRLRKELDEGRQLILASLTRELLKAEMLKMDRVIYEQRAQLKAQKKRLGIKTDDEDLINTKPQKKKPVDTPVVQRPPPPSALRLTTLRQEGRPAESADLTQLSDKLAEKENELLADIEKKVQNHKEWNKNHVDLTRGPLSPVKGRAVVQRFRPAKTQYLLTPPNSASSESNEEPDAMDLDVPNPRPVFEFRGIPQQENSPAQSPAYRRRVGRLNRLWIDRRGLSHAPQLCESSDRWRYDQDSDSDDEQPVYEVDPFDTRALRFRASIPLPQGWLGMRPPVPAIKAPTVPAELTAGARPALPMTQHPQAAQPQGQTNT